MHPSKLLFHQMLDRVHRMPLPTTLVPLFIGQGLTDADSNHTLPLPPQELLYPQIAQLVTCQIDVSQVSPMGIGQLKSPFESNLIVICMLIKGPKFICMRQGHVPFRK